MRRTAGNVARALEEMSVPHTPRHSKRAEREQKQAWYLELPIPTAAFRASSTLILVTSSSIADIATCSRVQRHVGSGVS